MSSHQGSPTFPVLLRVEDAAAAYGFTERQLRRWISEGKIARVKVSGATGPVFLKRTDLDQLVEEYTVPAGTKIKGNNPTPPKSKKRAR